MGGEIGAVERGMECGIKDVGQWPSGTVATGGTFHGAPVFEEEDIGGLKFELMGGHGIEPFGGLEVQAAMDSGFDWSGDFIQEAVRRRLMRSWRL